MKTINDIDTSTDYGKLLLAAISKITTESQTDKTPDEVLDQLNELSEAMFKTPEEISNKESTIALIFKAAKGKGLKNVSVRIDSDLEWVLCVKDLDRMTTDEGTLEQLLNMILEHDSLSWMNK